ncbi:MAG: 2-phospho-L-lactate transferase [Candidatus Gagatemarchaeaceae archaeon]
MKVVAIAGGTGSAKLIRGLSYLGPDLTVVANVGDNIWMHGLYVCPDVDIALYTLAGIADKSRGWGVEGDTFNSLAGLRALNTESWFALGDRDLATHIVRTALLRSGASLTEVTEKLRRDLHATSRVLPATDDPLETHVRTKKGLLHLQEFWVREGGRPGVTGVEYRGAARSRPSPQVADSIKGADRIVLCPANPVTSIGPILAIPGFPKLLQGARARITALSPMLGSSPFSGPAAKLMKAAGLRPNSLGVAVRYSGFLDAILIDSKDAGLAEEISNQGVQCHLSDIRMAGPEDETRLARAVLRA